MGDCLATLEYKSHFPSASALTSDLHFDMVEECVCVYVCEREYLLVDSYRISALLHYIILTSVH